MEGELEPINNLLSPGKDTSQETKNQGLINPYRQVLNFLEAYEREHPQAKKVTLQELKKMGLGSLESSMIATLIMGFKVDSQYLLDHYTEEEIREKYAEVPVSIKELKAIFQEKAYEWDLEHSNNLYDRYMTVKSMRLDLLTSRLSWNEFSEKRKLLVYGHYVMECLKQGENWVTLANLKKPSQFFYQPPRSRRVQFNEEAFKGFAKELGIDPETPIRGEDLAHLIVRRFGYTDDSLRGFYEEIVRDLIKPSGMRLPPCIEALAFRPLFYDTKKGRIIDEALKILASWFKYYAKGYTTGRIQKDNKKDKKVLLFEFMVSKLYGDVISPTEQAEIIQRFKKFYDDAKPFKCGMVHDFETSVKFGSGISEGGVRICDLKCPFIAPINRVEEALASIEDVKLYGADFIEIKAGNNKFLEPYSTNLTPRSKLVQKFTGFLSVLYDDPLITPDEALEILEALLERARIGQNYLSPLVAVEEWFREEMERLLEDGALPWELRAKDRPFLAKNKRVLYVHRDLIASDLLSAVGLENYTARKLLEDLKRLPNSPIVGISTPTEVRRDSYTDERTKAKFWLISVKWLEEHGISVKVKLPSLGESKPKEGQGDQEANNVEMNLPPFEKMILKATTEPIALEDLIDLGEQAGKSKEETAMAIASLMEAGLVEMTGDGKIKRVVRGGA